MTDTYLVEVATLLRKRNLIDERLARRVLVMATNQSRPKIVTPDVMFCSRSLQRQLSTDAQVGGCGTGEAEELEIGGDHLEQHVAPHLNCAAFVLGGS